MRVQSHILPLFLLVTSIDALPSYRRDVTHAADIATGVDAETYEEVSTFKHATPPLKRHIRRGLERRQQ